ncbi:hypothetical protein [Vibrio splendidus]|uniref:hypothetical protein n=1 Tax=Vibrio splendidus TaxID=29497 RepID=UPI000D3BCCD2|nr:hypothetical protein [Vibrio splendidus]PTP43456.1 hypothetical protein CWN87_10545 [Vibrio splendidus]
MAYKIAYLEDLDAGSIKRNVEQQGFDVTHIEPQGSFEDTLSLIQSVNADLLLMDFRLHAGVANFNAPPFAQFFRSQVIDDGASLPIALISSENNIRDYYRDYTSFDLFDFAVDKETFLSNTPKYCCLFKELIDSYRLLGALQSADQPIDVAVMNVPDALLRRVDRRLLDMLSMDKYQDDPFMLSGLLLSSFVKPIGPLIGSDVLSARLGVSKGSQGWEVLQGLLDDFIYRGLYSGTYRRWWSQGVEVWWKQHFPSEPVLRRLTSRERCQLISEKFELDNLVELDKLPLSNSNRLWTICAGSFEPLDPIDGFEIARDVSNSPWLDINLYSFDFLVNQGTPEILKELKEQERERFLQKAKEA